MALLLWLTMGRKIARRRGKPASPEEPIGFSDNWILIPAFLACIALSIARFAVLNGHALFSREAIGDAISFLALMAVVATLVEILRFVMKRIRKRDGSDPE